jgi:hypothetical protein
VFLLSAIHALFAFPYCSQKFSLGMTAVGWFCHIVGVRFKPGLFPDAILFLPGEMGSR